MSVLKRPEGETLSAFDKIKEMLKLLLLLITICATPKTLTTSTTTIYVMNQALWNRMLPAAINIDFLKAMFPKGLKEVACLFLMANYL